MQIYFCHENDPKVVRGYARVSVSVSVSVCVSVSVSVSVCVSVSESVYLLHFCTRKYTIADCN